MSEPIKRVLGPVGPAVHLFVPPEYCGAREALAADVTRIWLLPGVRTHMPAQVTRAPETLASFLCMLKDLPHSSQVKTLSAVCVFLCSFKLLKLLNPRPQMSHKCGFSPEWIMM